MTLSHLSLQFELYDGDGLVHPCRKHAVFLSRGHLTFHGSGQEVLTGVVGISVHCERGQRHEVDAVAVLQCCHVGVAEREPEHIGYAAGVSCGGSHPQGIMVAPLNVEVVTFLQVVHDDVRAWSAVEYVAQDVELVNAQALDDRTDGSNETLRLPRLYDAPDDAVEIGVLVIIARTFVQHFLYDVGEALGQSLAHLAARVFAGYRLAHLHQAEECAGIELVKFIIGSILGGHFQPALRVIYQGAEFSYLSRGEHMSEKFGDLALDVSAGIAQYVQECLVFTVYVRHEMFRALG